VLQKDPCQSYNWLLALVKNHASPETGTDEYPVAMMRLRSTTCQGWNSQPPTPCWSHQLYGGYLVVGLSRGDSSRGRCWPLSRTPACLLATAVMSVIMDLCVVSAVALGPAYEQIRMSSGRSLAKYQARAAQGLVGFLRSSSLSKHPATAQTATPTPAPPRRSHPTGRRHFVSGSSPRWPSG
jgi:hypothetical protein